MNPIPSLYAGHRYPPEIISHAVWLYFRFALSYRDVEELLAERGVIVTYETIRHWCEKFGRRYAKRLRAQRGPLGDTWYLEEVSLKINGRLQYLWRAVDQEGSVLDILVQPRRDKQAATRCFKRLLRGAVRIAAALDNPLEGQRSEQSRGEFASSYQAAREADAPLQVGGAAQKFLPIFDMVYGHFSIGRHALTEENARLLRQRRFIEWNHIVQVASGF